MNLHDLRGHTNSFVVMPLVRGVAAKLEMAIAAVGGTEVSLRRVLLAALADGQDDIHHDLNREVALIERVAKTLRGSDIVFLVETEWGLTKLSSEAREDLWNRAIPPFGLRNLGPVVVYTALAEFVLEPSRQQLQRANRLLLLEDLLS